MTEIIQPSQMTTAVLSARCTPSFLEQVDDLARSRNMKRGEFIIHAIEHFKSGSPGKGKKPTKDNIQRALKEIGPSTCPEIGLHLGCSKNQVSRRMRDLWLMDKVYPEGERASAETGKMLAVWHLMEAER